MARQSGIGYGSLAAFLNETGSQQSSVNGVMVKETSLAASTGRLKIWDGSAWALKPAKVWSGSAWVTKPAKIWNGSAWI